MSGVSALRELAIGVSDLAERRRFYECTFGLTVLAEGRVDHAAARALWGADGAADFVRLGREDVANSPTLRLVAVAEAQAPRPGADLAAAGPVGVGFTTRGVQAVYDRVAAAGVRFLSPPLRLTPGNVGPTGPVRFEAFGQAPDGEFVVLIERVNAATPYGAISDALGVSEPLHSSHVVTNLEACSRFMIEAMGHEPVIRDRAEEPIFEALMGMPPGTKFRFEMLHRPGHAAGRIIFIQYDGAQGAQPQVAALARGVHALRYDCDDLDAVARRVEPAGGRIKRGPVRVQAGPLGSGRVLVVRPPFGTLVEIWQAA